MASPCIEFGVIEIKKSFEKVLKSSNGPKGLAGPTESHIVYIVIYFLQFLSANL